MSQNSLLLLEVDPSKLQYKEVNTVADSEIQIAQLDTKLDAIDRKLDEAKGERKSAQLLMALLTAVITSVVGLAAWVAQSQVQKHIDQQSQDLATILALKQQVYSRELDRYESVHQQMAILAGALAEAQADPSQKKSADDAINKLYLTYETDSLYLSDVVVGRLKVLVTSSGNLPVLVSPNVTATNQGVDPMQSVNEQIATIEDQMKQDLHLSQLGQISTATGGKRVQ